MTLIELLVAVAIISVLAGLFFPAVIRAAKRAKLRIETIQVGHQMKTSIFLDDTARPHMLMWAATNQQWYTFER